MTPSVFERVIQLTVADPPDVWHEDYFILERGRFIALALSTSLEWFPAALSCIRLPNAGEVAAGDDIQNVNWDLTSFFAAWTAWQPTNVLPVLSTLLADETYGLLALATLSKVSDFPISGFGEPLHNFLIKYKDQAHKWSDAEFDYYIQSFIALGAETAIADLSALLEHLPASSTEKRNMLTSRIEHFKSLVQRDDLLPSPEKQKECIAAGLAHMKKQGVIQLILDSSRSRF